MRKGKQPRVANMLVESHLRPVAVKAGVLVKNCKVRFGFHNLRHSLASFLVRTKTDPEDRASPATAFGRENDSATLCSQRQ